MRWNLLWTATNSQQELSGYRKYGDGVKYAHSDDTRTQVTTVTRVFPTVFVAPVGILTISVGLNLIQG